MLKNRSNHPRVNIGCISEFLEVCEYSFCFPGVWRLRKPLKQPICTLCFFFSRTAETLAIQATGFDRLCANQTSLIGFDLAEIIEIQVAGWFVVTKWIEKQWSFFFFIPNRRTSTPLFCDREQGALPSSIANWTGNEVVVPRVRQPPVTGVESHVVSSPFHIDQVLCLRPR
jgi:hypothetical protein